MTDSDTYIVKHKRYKPTDPRLGRHVHHDSRSLNYLVPAVPDPTSLTSVRHLRGIPVLDQGSVGSCTGNAATGCIGTGLFYVPSSGIYPVLSVSDASLDETYALGVYSDAEVVDGVGPYPPNDQGSSGLSVAKVLKTRGLIDGYLHATSLEAALTALSTQPVIIGIAWHQDMFTPAADGRLSITGAVAGGHEIVLDELDVENKRVWMTNSWGTGWGLTGRAYLTWDDFAALLAEDGDCTVFIPVAEASPVQG